MDGSVAARWMDIGDVVDLDGKWDGKMLKMGRIGYFVGFGTRLLETRLVTVIKRSVFDKGWTETRVCQAPNARSREKSFSSLAYNVSNVSMKIVHRAHKYDNSCYPILSRQYCDSDMCT